MFPMIFLSGSFFPLGMMPGSLQTFAGILPRYDVNERLRASMVCVHPMTALHAFAIRATFVAVVLVVGRMTTKWEDGT